MIIRPGVAFHQRTYIAIILLRQTMIFYDIFNFGKNEEIIWAWRLDNNGGLSPCHGGCGQSILPLCRPNNYLGHMHFKVDAWQNFKLDSVPSVFYQLCFATLFLLSIPPIFLKYSSGLRVHCVKTGTTDLLKDLVFRAHP